MAKTSAEARHASGRSLPASGSPLRQALSSMLRHCRSLLAALLLSLLLLPSCGGPSPSGAEAPQLPASRGLPYELVLVVPRGIYAGELRDTLDAVLLGSTPLLPQHEPLFRLDVAYTDANLTPWRTFRSRLLLDIDPALPAPEMGVARNVAARPQIEVRLAAPTPHDLAQFIGARRQQLTDLFVDHELEVEAARLTAKHDARTRDSLQALCGHTVCVPPAFRAAKCQRDFLWTGTNLNDRDQNFVYYSYPWDGCPLSPQRFVEKHDSALQRNIPGARTGQWMQTARTPLPAQLAAALSDEDFRQRKAQQPPVVIARMRNINGKDVQELHGLWELRGGALGGPFVALEMVDTAARRVLVAEGFIYSPHSPKRDLLRQMQAALRTFR